MKWERAVILVDMNCFFAAVEQLDHPEMRSKPVAVTHGEQGSCIITCSYEARRYGIKTGMRLKEAKRICPDLIQAVSRNNRYIDISNRIMNALQAVTPDIEVDSIDEAFLEITKCLDLYKSPIEAAQKVKKIVTEVSGLPCSIGLSGDKTTAKYAAELKKPNGFVVIPPWEAEKTLANVRVTKLCGIGEKIGELLATHGVVYCKDMIKMPMSILMKRFGNKGRRIWLMCQGKDDEPVCTEVAPPKSIGHSKVLPPNTNDIGMVKTYFLSMAEKVALRLRYNKMYAETFYIGMLSRKSGWISIKYRVAVATDDGGKIYDGCEALLEKVPNPGVIIQVQVTALDPQAGFRQLSLFEEEGAEKKKVLNTTIDNINQKFGGLIITKAPLIKNKDGYEVIAWGSHTQRTKAKGF